METFSAEKESTDDGRLKSPHSSPTLLHVRQPNIGEPGPDDVVACRDCPVSVWYWQGSDKLFCFCAAMHKDVWGSGEHPVIFCDAREQEVAKLMKKSLTSDPDPDLDGLALQAR